jgi:hypothetical protein
MREYETPTARSMATENISRILEDISAQIGIDLPHLNEFFILGGAKIPFVLRKTSCVDESTLVGETYLYGLMRGELMREPFSLRATPVDIY